MAYLHYQNLIDRGLVPLRDMEDVVNGYLDKVVDWIPGVKNMRLKDLPSFIRTTDSEDIMLNFAKHEVERISMASAIILNTFDDFEHQVLQAMCSILPPLYTIGPLQLLAASTAESSLATIGSNLWKEEPVCLEWLEGKKPQSVVYVNFGSVTVISNEQLIEFAWGLASSKHDFLWIIRPDLVRGDTAVLPQEFLEETKERGLLASWCSQEEVLRHPSIGGFLTHCGWNSTLESICGGVPVICWPFFAEQQTNCRYLCTEWGIGMEIDNNVRRQEVEGLIKELMNGEKGMEMRKKALEWKELAIRATEPDMEVVNNGYLDTVIDWIPGMKNMRLRDFPTFIRTTNHGDMVLNFVLHETHRVSMASAIILNTFSELEHPILEAMTSIQPPVYTIGPLHLLYGQIPESRAASIGSNLWKEEPGCMEWLEGKKPQSVVYVNFGSVTVMNNEQLREFAWGLANSKHNFLWIIRPGLVRDDTAVLPQEFIRETKERGLLASWCSQEDVLRHPSIGGFLTHCGWNSTLESICGGVPVICWPFFAEQQTNCRYLCTEWGIGMEIDNNVKREEVEGLIKELMTGEKGMKMRKKALEWKEHAENAAGHGGSSFNNLERLVCEVLLAKTST
ncbi:hypothetical protein J5N97_006775 [Dioscorea zingiberensis]|uniref:Glycosyltransferase n=1 Tax=Dioscorea zingiberensis TaxID=325984 RepID=A0A9D5DBZ1_9LILI|nr:hypothetical protein J5N97_006775 [Dioscorea zingiberensis]